MARIYFITGTDTGVGKTVLTAMLLCYLREKGVNAMAMKPFCSGSRRDAELLHHWQKKVLTLDEVNPFYFEKPLAPAAAGGRKNILLDVVVGRIEEAARRCEVLLVEGIGGVMVPLGENYTVGDLMGRLECEAIVVGRNRLGAINHTLLTVNALQAFGVKEIAIVMMEEKKKPEAARSNPGLIRKMLPKNRLFLLPHLGFGASRPREIKNNVTFLKKTLARILAGAILHMS